MKKILLLFLFYLSVSITTQAMDDDTEINIASNDFMDIHQLSQKIWQICPPKNCVVVGIGQSPTPIIAYLETEHTNYAWSIPLSHFGHGVAMPYLQPQTEKRLNDHFEQFLPSSQKLGNRTILLLDYTGNSGGASLLAVSRYVEKYLAQKYQHPPKVLIAAFRADNYLERIPFCFNYIFIFDKKNNFINNIKKSNYKEYSPFGMFHVTNFAEEADTILRPEYIKMRQYLHKLKNSQYQLLEYPGGPVPNFKTIRQSGSLDVSYKDLLGERDVTWYIHQLSYYRGPDAMRRFLELFLHDDGAQRLTDNWSLFSSLPAQQERLLNRLISKGEQTILNTIARSYDAIAPELQNTYLVFLLKNISQEARAKFISLITLVCGEQMATVVKQLRQDESLKNVTDLMLDQFLLPNLVIEGNNFGYLKETIASRFRVLLDDPDTEAIALQKYQSYATQRLDLPIITMSIEDPGNEPEFHLVPILNNAHKSLRASIIKRIGELWEDTIDEDMGDAGKEEQQ